MIIVLGIEDPEILHIYADFLSKFHFLLLLVYTNRCNRFLVLINIGNDISFKQIGCNSVMSIFQFWTKIAGPKKVVAHNLKTEGQRT